MTSCLSRFGIVPFVLLLATAMPVDSFAQSATGGVRGRVTDGVSSSALVGADVTIVGTAHMTATDHTGAFHLFGIPEGDYTLQVLYLGHATGQVGIRVVPGRTLDVAVELAAASFSETVQVSVAPIAEGQANALNVQRTAPSISSIVSSDQIGAFPDPNAADAASRIPGVSIARDQGEGRYVLVRGTEARLNSVMIDGERIPAPEGDTRQVQLDAVPADQLQSIEVSKAVTPDMDADSIGGAVNLITRQAIGRPTALFTAAGGYHALQGDYGQRQFSGTVGRRFAGGRVGILAGGSSSSANRGSENFEAVYDGGGLSDLQLRDYQIRRERYGLNMSGDVQAASHTSLTIRSIFNEFQDYEVNNRIRFRPPNSRIEHVLKNRNQRDHIRAVSATLQHVLQSRVTIDYRLAWASSREDQPDRLDTIFRQSRISFAPNVSASSIDPTDIQPNPSANNASAATLNAWETEIFDTRDRDVTASFNVRSPLTSGAGNAAFLKFGGKVKDKNKQRDFEVTTASPAGTVPFGDLQDRAFDNSRFLSFFPAGYAPFPGIDADASRAMFNALPASRIEVDHEGDAADYDANERVVAGYVMGEFFIGDRLFILPGLRFETTRVDYTGYSVIYDDGGDYASTVPVTGGESKGFLLPGLHVRYSVNPDTNLRAAITRTLARPNYYDLVPYQLVFQEDGEISRGNASLRPTTSTNVDVLAERYLQSVGLVSGGVFYKRLADYIFPFRFGQTNFGDLYQVTQPQNGESGSLWGVELVFQNQFRSLPAPFDGLGIYSNYTFTDSSATFPDRAVTSSLPGQSRHIGNFSVSYEKFGFSSKASWNFHGKYIDAVGSTPAEDIYYDNHTQFDLSVSQRLTRQIRAYADFVNLTNAPLRYFQGVTNRPIQEEYYRWWSSFGLKVNF